MLDNPMDKKVRLLNLKLIMYKLLAKHLLMIENFIPDIDLQVANSLYLLLFLNLTKFLNIHQFGD
jgi:hypothetical protein